MVYQYVLVRFKDDGSTSIVPASWIDDAGRKSNDCTVAFPPKKEWSKMRTMLVRQVPASSLWNSYSALILHKAGERRQNSELQKNVFYI